MGQDETPSLCTCFVVFTAHFCIIIQAQHMAVGKKQMLFHVTNMMCSLPALLRHHQYPFDTAGHAATQSAQLDILHLE